MRNQRIKRAVGEVRIKFWKLKVGENILPMIIIGALIRIYLSLGPLNLMEVEFKLRTLNLFSFGPLASLMYSPLPDFLQLFRVISIMSFVLSSILIYLISREYSKIGAEIGVLVFSFEPHSIVYFSYSSPLPVAVLLFLLTIFLVKEGVRKENHGYFILSGVSAAVLSYYSPYAFSGLVFLLFTYLAGILIKARGLRANLRKLREVYEKIGELKYLREKGEGVNLAVVEFKLKKLEEISKEYEEEVEGFNKALSSLRYSFILVISFIASSAAIGSNFSLKSFYMSTVGYIPLIFGSFPLSPFPYGQGKLLLHLIEYSPIFLLFTYILLFEDVYLETAAGISMLLFILLNPTSSPWTYMIPLIMILIGAPPVVAKKISKEGIKTAFGIASLIIIAFTLFQGAVTSYGCLTGGEALIGGQIFLEGSLRKAYNYYISQEQSFPYFKVESLPSYFSDVIKYEGYKIGSPGILLSSSGIGIGKKYPNAISMGPIYAFRGVGNSPAVSLFLSPSYVFWRSPNHIKIWQIYIFIIGRE